MSRPTNNLSYRQITISPSDNEEIIKKKKAAINEGSLALNNLPIQKRIMVDASHDVTDGLSQMIEIAEIVSTEGKSTARALIDPLTFVSNKKATPFGASNPYCVANRTSKFAMPELFEKDTFDRAFDIVYSLRGVKSYKVRRSSGSGRMGTRLDDILAKNRDKDARKIALLNGDGGYIAPHHHHDDLPVNTVVLNYVTELDKMISKAFERLEARTNVKAAALTGSLSMAVTEDLAEYYQLSKAVIGKKLYWMDDNGVHPYRPRTVVTHPLQNYLCSIFNSTFSIAPVSNLYSPIITLPNCEDFNKINNFADVTDFFLYDWIRFGPSMVDAALIYSNSKLAKLVADFFNVDYNWAFSILNQNTSPQVVEYTDESGRKTAYLNPTAGCLDGISRTSTFNSLFNTYYLFIALKMIGYDISKIKTDEDLRINDKFGCIMVGDGGFVHSKDKSFLSTLKEALLEIGPKVSLGSGLSVDKDTFCGLRFFRGVGFGFNEWSVTKLLRPERSASDRKMRPNPRAGILASLDLFDKIKSDRRILSRKVVNKILLSLANWYDLKFADISPEAKVDDIGELSLHYRPGSSDSDYDPEFLSYYWIFDDSEARSIIKRSALRFTNSVDMNYVNKFDKVFK